MQISFSRDISPKLGWLAHYVDQFLVVLALSIPSFMQDKDTTQINKDNTQNQQNVKFFENTKEIDKIKKE